MTGHTLPPDWQPTDNDVMYGLSLGLTSDMIMDAAESMRLWAEANANRQIARKANWSAAFKGWLRRVAQKRGTHVADNPIGNAFDQIRDRYQSQGSVSGSVESAPDRGPSGDGGQATFGFLPPRQAG